MNTLPATTRQGTATLARQVLAGTPARLNLGNIHLILLYTSVWPTGIGMSRVIVSKPYQVVTVTL